ncbi:MAG TPA: NAD-dependent deacetylase [Rhodospirillaceae bacterium]|nr:NAD-dependent deacetylase [Rhodospirillaceae bacterium]HAT36539.1 NAD-dependent deacetylase [Rhodospirillaceae bacterium]
MPNDAKKVAEFAEMLENSKRAVIFTGAGISTESGIPDFRSPGGIWEKFKPVMFQDFLASAERRQEYWRQRFFRHDDMIQAEPNRGHRAVEKLVRTGKVSAVITQNTDGLHQKSGVPEEKIIELHGNSTYAHCLNCGSHCELDWIKEIYERDGVAPDCEECGGLVKTATVAFGQSMPEDKMREAQVETLACDLLISIGSSLQVFPAAGFPIMAKQNDSALVILNRDPTDLDRYADIVLNEEIGPTLGDVVGVN